MRGLGEVVGSDGKLGLNTYELERKPTLGGKYDASKSCLMKIALSRLASSIARGARHSLSNVWLVDVFGF